MTDLTLSGELSSSGLNLSLASLSLGLDDISVLRGITLSDEPNGSLVITNMHDANLSFTGRNTDARPRTLRMTVGGASATNLRARMPRGGS